MTRAAEAEVIGLRAENAELEEKDTELRSEIAYLRGKIKDTESLCARQAEIINILAPCVAVLARCEEIATEIRDELLKAEKLLLSGGEKI